jgi:hypothetical protein
MELDTVLRQVEGNVRHVQAIIGEVFLDHVALEAAADDEIAYAVGIVELHDVPEDRPAANLDHRLRPQMCFLGNARSQTASENDGFHRLLRLGAKAVAGSTMTWRRANGSAAGRVRIVSTPCAAFDGTADRLAGIRILRQGNSMVLRVQSVFADKHPRS